MTRRAERTSALTALATGLLSLFLYLKCNPEPQPTAETAHRHDSLYIVGNDTFPLKNVFWISNREHTDSVCFGGR